MRYFFDAVYFVEAKNRDSDNDSADSKREPRIGGKPCDYVAKDADDHYSCRVRNLRRDVAKMVALRAS